MAILQGSSAVLSDHSVSSFGSILGEFPPIVGTVVDTETLLASIAPEQVVEATISAEVEIT